MRSRQIRIIGAWIGLGVTAMAISAGSSCPGGNLGGGSGGIGGGGSPTPPSGNQPPRIIITSISTIGVVQGDPVVINISGADAEDAAVARVFASLNADPTSAQELLIQSGIAIGPGAGNAIATWNTTSVPVGTYYIFAEIDDRTFDPATGTGNPPIRTVAATQVAIAPVGSQPQNVPPQLVFIDPLPNLGLSAQDEVTVRYICGDPDSPVKITLMLDKDRNPTNDDVNNPGDPNDPATNIIILPSTARLSTDPNFVDPADTAEIRTNPRTVNATQPGVLPFPGAPIAGQLHEYRFVIDFSHIPVRSQPYFIRANINDGTNVANAYATGSITISSLASGTVDVSDLGFLLAGARFQGFSAGDNFGSDFVQVPDVDGDNVDEFMIAARYATRFTLGRFALITGGTPPFAPLSKAPQSGAAYLIFGRRKTPFPADADANGVPDGFPTPPTFLPNPYDSRNVGRFGGTISINSVGSFFRGTAYVAPVSYIESQLPPAGQQDPLHVGLPNSGLTSITRLDLTNDGIPDFVFGVLYCSMYDQVDGDPVDGGCTYPYVCTGDLLPGAFICDNFPNDDIGISTQGVVFAVDGTDDLNAEYRKYMPLEIVGQTDPAGSQDDDNIGRPAALTAKGMHFRGGFFNSTVDNNGFAIIDENNEFGATVAAMPSIDNDTGEDLLVSVPNHNSGAGRVDVWFSYQALGSKGYIDPQFYGGDTVASLPGFTKCGGGLSCVTNIGCIPPGGTACIRCLVGTPFFVQINGELPGDRLGFARSAGQFNQDGIPDIMCGAPNASHKAVVNGVETGPDLSMNGTFYVLFTPASSISNINVSSMNRLEVRGLHDNDHFGEIQTPIRDINGDGVDDVAFASENFKDDAAGHDGAGYVGVIFGNRPITGEAGFSPLEVATPLLPGVKFFGTTTGAHAGHRIATAGDFNNDGYGDLLISCPGESRIVDGQTRLGVVYLIFGGTHLINKSFNLAQVGSAALPGIVFIGRAFAEDIFADNAPLQTVGSAGDVDGDGFDDILIGAPLMDFVNLASPNQRRVDAGEVYLIYGSNFGSNKLP